MSYANLFRRENSWTISICIVLTKSPNFRCFFAAKLSTVNKNALKAATDASSRYIHKYVTSARFSPHETYGSVSFRSFSCSHDHVDPNSVSCGCWPYFSEIRLLRRPGMAEVQGPANCQEGDPAQVDCKDTECQCCTNSAPLRPEQYRSLPYSRPRHVRMKASSVGKFPSALIGI